MKPTHVVLDLVYTEEEGQECFYGSYSECQEFIATQQSDYFTYKIVPNI